MLRGALILVAACGGARAGAIDASVASIDTTIAPVDAPEAIDAAPLPPQTARLRIVNRCAPPIWISHSDNFSGEQNAAIASGGFHDYDIPAGGLPSVRFWPKTGCDATGHACATGDTGEGGGTPCGANGCEPPSDSKFEATFAALGSSDATFYNLSLVDGYTLPFAVAPLGAGGGSCVASDCSTLTIDACPAELKVGDVECLSPCKQWNYPPPYGQGKPESQDPGYHYCCPAPMSPDACRDESDPLSVTHTAYVALVHARCPSAYSYAYDDGGGLHACPAATKFEVTFCP